MNLQLVQEIGKWGIGTILAVGLCVILYTAIADDKETEAKWLELMERQTQKPTRDNRWDTN